MRRLLSGLNDKVVFPDRRSKESSPRRPIIWPKSHSLRFDGVDRLQFTIDTKLGHRLEIFRTSALSNSICSASEHITNKIHSRVRRQRTNEKDLLDPPEQWNSANSKERKIIAASIYHRMAKVLASEFTAGLFPLQHPDLNQQRGQNAFAYSANLMSTNVDCILRAKRNNDKGV